MNRQLVVVLVVSLAMLAALGATMVNTSNSTRRKQDRPSAQRNEHGRANSRQNISGRALPQQTERPLVESVNTLSSPTPNFSRNSSDDLWRTDIDGRRIRVSPSARPEGAMSGLGPPPGLDANGGAGSYGYGGAKTVYVRSYTREDGTRVRGHYRSRPRR